MSNDAAASVSLLVGGQPLFMRRYPGVPHAVVLLMVLLHKTLLSLAI